MNIEAVNFFQKNKHFSIYLKNKSCKFAEKALQKNFVNLQKKNSAKIANIHYNF